MRFRVGPFTPAALSQISDGCATCRRWSSDRNAPWLAELLPQPSTIAVAATQILPKTESDTVPRVAPVAGYALATSSADVPAMATFVSGPVSDDALLLVTARVFEPYIGRGVGERLIHGVVKQTMRTNVRALEAYGDSASSVPGHTCLVPTQFLLAVGFSVVRRHPTYPRLRLDLRSIATWPSEVAQAADRLFGAVSARLPGRVPVSRVGDRS